jgi:hypothetical protein
VVHGRLVEPKLASFCALHNWLITSVTHCEAMWISSNTRNDRVKSGPSGAGMKKEAGSELPASSKILGEDRHIGLIFVHCSKADCNNNLHERSTFFAHLRT